MRNDISSLHKINSNHSLLHISSVCEIVQGYDKIVQLLGEKGKIVQFSDQNIHSIQKHRGVY